ncbi:MAG: sigma-54 dependent transcriptional regulator [Thermodesulfovibrionales bacterium]|nr:sigma-54 dependent transcriptional regulator [Thermodesulfovibrionales bacterium]
MLRILLIEDEPSIRLALKVFFEAKDYEVLAAETGEEGIDAALKNRPDIVLLDLRLPDAYGLNILKEIKSGSPSTAVYIMTAFGEINEAIEAIKLGAENYFQKPIDLDELGAIIEKSSEIIKLRQELAFCRKSPYLIIGRGRAVQGLIHMVNLMAENPSTTLLIRGETGTGKELVARNIHFQSIKGSNPFIDINCASIPENMIESEMFGYEAGAFTDAKSAKRGLIELADNGTLFLDEIGDMPLAAQSKLLRVIETKAFRRLGGTRDIKVEVRIIAATNKDIEQAVKNGTFREDLYYRLNVMPVTIPPLRERPEDIPLLAEFFLMEINNATGRKRTGFEKGAMELLCSYNWPGNIRELRNIIERASILAHGRVINAENIVLKSGTSPSAAPPIAGAGQKIEDIVRSHIFNVLESTAGNRTKAAKIMGISRSTLIEKMKGYDIQSH